MAVLHGVYLEAGSSRASVERYMKSLRVGTFDLGVEFALNTFTPISAREVFPWYTFTDDGECALQPANSLAFDHVDNTADHEISLAHMLSTPGPMHILDNATQSLTDGMPYVGQAMEPLIAVTRFLATKMSSERLASTCFSRPTSSMYQKQIKSFNKKVNPGRWGTVAFATSESLLLEWPLRKFFYLPTYKFTSEDDRE
eukprot:5871705-Amphidinium_carterae.1